MPGQRQDNRRRISQTDAEVARGQLSSLPELGFADAVQQSNLGPRSVDLLSILANNIVGGERQLSLEDLMAILAGQQSLPEVAVQGVQQRQAEGAPRDDRRLQAMQRLVADLGAGG